MDKLNSAIEEALEKEEKNEIPFLEDWIPKDEEIFMEIKGDYVKCRYEKLGLREDHKLSSYIIKKDHYRKRMDDICKVINYFLHYFDPDLDLLHSTMAIKFIIDQKPNMSKKAFRKFIVREVINDKFIANIKNMTNYLYRLNIDSDTEGKYKNTPKISNDQARLIVAVSFAIRCILPICIHFSDTNTNFPVKKDYIPFFDKIIVKLIEKFEKNDVKIIPAIEKFVKWRVERSWKADIGICLKKKQLYGTVQELYFEEIIHEVVLVKSLYKLDYNRSVVSFIDGVIFRYHMNFKVENFRYKPIEIDQQDTQDPENDRISRAEAIEMMVYRVDESNTLINDVNTIKVLETIRKSLNVPIEQEEFEYYRDNMVINPITELLLQKFYNKYFHDSDATTNLDLDIIIELIIRMKKYLICKRMILLPQITTAIIRGKYRENTIKNSKFMEKIKTMDVWNSVIEKKYTYIKELDIKDDFLLKKFSTLINCQFEFLDYNGPNDGVITENIDQDQIIYEFALFLSTC